MVGEELFQTHQQIKELQSQLELEKKVSNSVRGVFTPKKIFGPSKVVPLAKVIPKKLIPVKVLRPSLKPIIKEIRSIPVVALGPSEAIPSDFTWEELEPYWTTSTSKKPLSLVVL